VTGIDDDIIAQGEDLLPHIAQEYMGPGLAITHFENKDGEKCLPPGRQGDTVIRGWSHSVN
jgi:hypothetical protein